MSSEVEAGGMMAAAVILPVAAAYGAGWLAWQSGKLFVEAGMAINREAEAKKREIEERESQRKKLAYATRGHLVDMCNSILSELDSMATAVDVTDYESAECLKHELRAIIDLELTDDVTRIEGANLQGFSKIEAIVSKQKAIKELTLSNSSCQEYRKYAVADLMADFKVALMAATIKETAGSDVSAADPIVLERAKLNERFMTIVSKIMISLEHISQLTQEYGLSEASSKWFHSCFNGMDSSVVLLSQPTTSNDELKKGIKRLEGMMEQYEMMIPSIDKTCMEMHALYQVYVEVAKALGEKVEKKKSFKNADALEAKLQELKERSRRAEQCAEIYKKLGRGAYICYAWDQELGALGYTVHSRKEIMEKVNIKPEHAKVGDVKMPYYKWSETEMTQLYSVTSKCDLQVIVHEDGTVSMKTISNGNKETATADTQESHCSKLKRLHENLRRNWFLVYDYEEIETAEKVVSIEEWLGSADNEWKELPQIQAGGRLIGEREREREKAIERKHQST